MQGEGRNLVRVRGDGNYGNRGVEKSTPPWLEQAEVIRIPCLEGAYEDVEGGQFAQILEARVGKKKRPAGETIADAALQPFEGGFAAFEDGEDAGELIITVVGVAEGFGDGTGAGEAVERFACFAGHGEKKPE